MFDLIQHVQAPKVNTQVQVPPIVRQSVLFKTLKGLIHILNMCVSHN